MILLLGATSYVGRAFARALRWRKDSFIPLTREAFDYTRFEFLFDYVRKIRPALVINTAEVSERDGESTESDRVEMLKTNTVLPQTIARVCAATNTAFAHVSSGSIYSGAKVLENGGFKVVEDLAIPEIRSLFVAHPERFRGFTELDDPNFSFNCAPCTFYSGTKALAEEALRNLAVYIWRLRLPFNHVDDQSNFLSYLQDGAKFHDAINSLSHLDECVAACLELWERRAPVGIYNIANPGPIRTQQVVQMIHDFLKPSRHFRLLVYSEGCASERERATRSDCILDVSKLLSFGIKLSSCKQALETSLQKWESQAVSIAGTYL